MSGKSQSASERQQTEKERQTRKGPVMPIGGAEERSPHGIILRTFVELSGGKSAKIVVIPTASSDPTTGGDYVDVFKQIGVESAEIAQIGSREEANSEAMVELLRSASGIFITGGDQGRLSKLVVGSLASETIQHCNNEGAVVAGTSAGAATLGSHMISRGQGESPPRKGIVEILAGFGVLDQVIIDMHFHMRGRIGRLLVAFAGNPGLLAFGIDENTAVVVQPDGMAKVIGENSVAIVDGRNVYSDYHDREEGEILTITGSCLHVLAPGRIFDLNKRQILNFIQEQISPHAA